jgi:hypothetical protein
VRPSPPATRPIRTGFAHCPSPGRTSESSPPFQRWVSPVKRFESRRDGGEDTPCATPFSELPTSRPALRRKVHRPSDKTPILPSLRESIMLLMRLPMVETVGYFRSPLRGLGGLSGDDQSCAVFRKQLTDVPHDLRDALYRASTSTARWPLPGVFNSSVPPPVTVCGSCHLLRSMSSHRTCSVPLASETSSFTSPPSGK